LLAGVLSKTRPSQFRHCYLAPRASNECRTSGGGELGRVDLIPFLPHTFSLNQVKDVNDLFGYRAEGVIKVAMRS
jgi:hypothetical protein